MRDGEETYEVQESDVVCIRSAAADASGYHSMVPVDSNGHCMLPPLAL